MILKNTQAKFQHTLIAPWSLMSLKNTPMIS